MLSRTRVPVADARTPLLRHLARRRQRQPDYTLASDGVHIHGFAHGFLARALLEKMGLGPSRPAVAVEPGVNFSVAPPIPFDPAWQGEWGGEETIRRVWTTAKVVFSDAVDVIYRIRESGKPIATVHGSVLRTGFDLSQVSAWSGNRRAPSVLTAVVGRQRLLRDAWLFRTGHERPGMPTGKPIRSALREVSEISARIAVEIVGPELGIERA